MNKLSLTRQELQREFLNETTLGAVFSKMERDLALKGEIVCRFLVNGLTLTEDDEKRFSEFQLSEVEFLEVESETPKTLLAEVLNNWVETLPGMIIKSDSLASNIRLKGIENQMRDFVDLVDTCQFLVESLISLRTLCQDIPFVSGAQWKTHEDLTARAIAEALNVFEKKDFVLLADIMEYDLGHCLQSWLDSLTELKGHVLEKASYSLGG
jgi:hypothetical protein